MALSMSMGCRVEKADSAPTESDPCRMADSLMARGNYQKSMKGYIEALKVASEAGDDSRISHILKQIGTIYAFHDDEHRALDYYRRSLEYAEKCMDTAAQGLILPNLVLMNRSIGNRAQEEYYMELFSKLPASANKNIGYYRLYIPFVSHIEAGDDDEARRLSHELSQYISLHGMRDGSEAVLYNHWGMRFAQKNEYDSAVNCYRKALVILEREPLPSTRQAVYTNMCALFKHYGMSDSLARYREKMVESSFSNFNLRDFSLTKEELENYEKELESMEKEKLRLRSWYIVGVAVAVIALLASFIIYALLRKKNETAAPAGTDAEPESPDDDGGKTPDRLTLADSLRDRLSGELLALLEEEDLVFNPDLNINILALRLNTNTKYVTEVIHGLGGQNFRSFINEHRVREACRRLSDKDNYGNLTIAAIAAEVGFNSHNSFISAFRKVAGMTPAQYRALSPEEAAKVYPGRSQE